MADITREIAKKDAKILLDTIGMVQTLSGRQTVGGTQQEWSTYSEKGNTVVELKKIIEKYNSSEALKLLESEYEKLYFKKGGLGDLKGSLLNRDVFSEDQMSRIVKLKKENPNKSLLELDLIDEGKEYSKIKRNEKGELETSMFTSVGDLYSKHKETIAKQIPVNEKHPNADITLEEITKRYQGGDPTTPLDVSDIEALDVKSAFDLIIENKLPLTDEARGTLNMWLKFHPEDYINKFRSVYFKEDELDVPSVQTEETIEKPIPGLDEDESFVEPNVEEEVIEEVVTEEDAEIPEVIETPEEGQPSNRLQNLGGLAGNILKGAAGVLDGIGGPGAIISYMMGKKGLKAAMKEIVPQKRPELSPMFMQHMRQVKELSKKGFHPAEEMKFRKEIDNAYQHSLEKKIRGTGGDRAKFLAQTGILDAARSSALLDYAAKDAELQRKNQDRYEKMMLFKENYDIQRTEQDRLEDLERQVANKEAAINFTSAAFTNAMSGLNKTSVSGLVEKFLGATSGGNINVHNPEK